MENVWEECRHCERGFFYFAKKYVKIVNPKLGLVDFPMYEYQERLAREYDNNRFVITVKFRQAGLTTLTALYCLWRCLFHQGQKIQFVSRTYREAEAIGEMLSLTINGFPAWLQQLVGSNTKHKKTFPFTDSVFYTHTWEACRGKALTHVVIDEAAFIDDLDSKWPYVFPCLGENGKCFALSTPNKVSEWFFDTWHGAMKAKNNFKAVEVHYYEHPDFQNPEWVEAMRQQLGERGWRQEVLGDFFWYQ